MSETEVRKLDRKLDEVLFILQNNDRTGSKGLVSKVDSIEERLDTFTKQYNIDIAVKKAKDTVWKIVFGFVGAAILKGIALLFKI